MISKGDLLISVGLVLLQIVPLLSIHRDVLASGQRGHASRAQDILCQPGVPLERNSQTLDTLLLRSNELLGSGLANQLLLRRRSASNLEQCNRVGLGDGRELGVVSSHITLPVRVLGNVCGGDGDRVVVCVGIEATGGRVAELRVHGDTGGALGVEREQPVDRGIDACRLDRVFLQHHGQQDATAAVVGFGGGVLRQMQAELEGGRAPKRPS